MYANLIKLSNKIKHNYKCTIIRYLFITFCQSSNSQERFLFQTIALPPPPPAPRHPQCSKDVARNEISSL